MHKPPALVCEFAPPAHQQRPSLIAAAHGGAPAAALPAGPAAIAEDDLIAQVEAAIRGEPVAAPKPQPAPAPPVSGAAMAGKAAAARAALAEAVGEAAGAAAECGPPDLSGPPEQHEAR
jgi:hypothetical protein